MYLLRVKCVIFFHIVYLFSLLSLFTGAVNAVPEYPQFSKILAQAITFINWTAVNAWQSIAPYKLLPLEHKQPFMTLFQVFFVFY